MILLYIFLFLIGIVTGSFLNVLICRYGSAESIIAPRSHCDKCGTFLRARDLVPLFSFLLLRGRCRYCGCRLSPQYPLMELAAAAIFMGCFHFYGFGPLFVKHTVMLCLLLVISGIDRRLKIIPNPLVLAVFGWALLWQFLDPQIPSGQALSGLLAGAGLFLAIAALSKGGMGGGDVKLMAALSFVAGWPLAALLFFFSFLLGGLTGAAMLALNRKTRKDPLPFGPFIALAYLITLFRGELIMNWYLSLL